MTIENTKKKEKNQEGGKEVHTRENMTNKAIEKLYLLKVISKDQESSARTLYRSCLQAYQRTRDKSKPWYKNVEYHFANPLDMVMQFIMQLPKEWEKWQAQQIIYEDITIDGLRPSIDRIDSEGHYSIDNLQTDSIKGNYTGASTRRRKKTVLIEIENGQLGFKVYESQTKLRNELNISASKLRNMKKRPYQLSYKSADKEVEVLDKKYITLDYIEYPPRPKEEQNKLDKQSYLDLIERIRMLESLPFNKQRTEHIEKLKENLVLFKEFGWHKL